MIEKTIVSELMDPNHMQEYNIKKI